ncbi:ABC-F family ATP-binding cassette domain-containing protein [Marinibaculum pumilum]|uniref:ABC-F family ATP-binding cassette domain-containing protein n=1 Tax=Marinibaculum pumilum TaxID=1766165 RepID=A0ABV7KXR8_9PROT
MLNLDGITLRIAGRPLIEEASVALPPGQRTGLVGRNGAGKSTLLAAISGALSPDAGTIRMPPRARMGMLRQEAPGGAEEVRAHVLAGDEERTAILAALEAGPAPEEMAELHARLDAIGAHAAPARAAGILHGLGFDEAAQQRPLSAFSGGWRMRVALARLLFSAPDLLLLDEPSNHLDFESTVWLDGFLRRYPHTVLLVSHDRALLDHVDHILHLEAKRLTLYRGAFPTFQKTRMERLAQDAALVRREQAEREKLTAFITRFRAKATKARQAQSKMKRLEKLTATMPVIETDTAQFALPEIKDPLPPPLLTGKGIQLGYGEGPPVLAGLDFRIDPEDRIALLGANGNGKSTFARYLAGELKPRDGEETRARKLRVGYFAQHQLDALRPADTPLGHIQRALPDLAPPAARSRLARFGLGAAQAETQVERLSGGERARLALTLVCAEEPHILVLDEPTNHLDLDARGALVTALTDYAGALVLISHDRHIIEHCADALWITRGGTIRPFDGDLDDYAASLSDDRPGPASRAAGADAQPSANRKEERRAAAERRAQLAPLRKAAEKAERQVERLTRDLQAVQAQLADPGIYEGDGGKVADLAGQEGRLKKALEEAEERWLEAQEALETAE